MRASTQLKQIIKFIPTLISILFIFIFALLVAFLSSTTSRIDDSVIIQPATRLIFGSLLIVMLPVHLIMLVRLFWSLVLSRHAADEASRIMDERHIQRIEKRHPLDYATAIKKWVDSISTVYGVEESNVNSEEKPNESSQEESNRDKEE